MNERNEEEQRPEEPGGRKQMRPGTILRNKGNRIKLTVLLSAKYVVTFRSSGSINPMSHHKADHKRHRPNPELQKRKPPANLLIIGIGAVAIIVILYSVMSERHTTKEKSQAPPTSTPATAGDSYHPTEKWLQRAYAIDQLFHYVYTPCWEGANGAIGDAYLFATTQDSSLLRFHLSDHDLRRMCVGTWVDDRAWVGLAEYYWWRFTGKTDLALIKDAEQRYLNARDEGRLSHVEGYWTWYNWPPHASSNMQIFTNSNMNQMVTLACGIYEATGDKGFLDDALLVWNGDKVIPGIEKTLYEGNGIWEGHGGRAAFGKEIPWNGAEFCSIGAALYRVTNGPKFKTIVVATARHIMDPANGWVDPVDYFQIHMDGNGNFVHYLMDAYEIAPKELSDIPVKIGKMLEHVWSNHQGHTVVTLHRESDNGIRNGWNPLGGEDGYNVDEIGTVHAQSQAVRAFGVYAYFVNRR